jgi:hypothetical protein
LLESSDVEARGSTCCLQNATNFTETLPTIISTYVDHLREQVAMTLKFGIFPQLTVNEDNFIASIKLM